MSALALAALATVVTQAHAAPVAYDARFLDAELRLVGGDGADWRLLLHATQLGSARTETPTSHDPQELRVDAERCTGAVCRPAGSWRVTLSDDQVEVAEDSTAARLDTVLFGQRLHVTLTPTGLESGTVRVLVGGASAAPGEGYADISRTVDAGGPWALGRTTCSVTTGRIGQAVVVAEESAPPGEPQVAPTGLLGRDGAVRCRD